MFAFPSGVLSPEGPRKHFPANWRDTPRAHFPVVFISSHKNYFGAEDASRATRNSITARWLVPPDFNRLSASYKAANPVVSCDLGNFRDSRTASSAVADCM